MDKLTKAIYYVKSGKGRWISVLYDPPEDSTEVIASVKVSENSAATLLAKYSHDDDTWNTKGKVTHWMPFPEDFILLKKCPCGQNPEDLTIEAGATCKWSYVSGSCCYEWLVEFRTKYEKDEDKLMQLAIQAWNKALRVGELL